MSQNARASSSRLIAGTLIALTLAGLAWLLAGARPAQADVQTMYTVPSSVPSGCSTDATSQILSWIASVPNNSTLEFGANACYRIEGTLEFHNRNLTLDGNGATFKSLNAPADQRAMWRAWDSTVSFRNMTIIGSYANGGVHDESLQHAHAIDLRGTHGVVENVSMSDLAGDCVYFGLGASRSSGAVRDSSCRRIGRNAVSVTAGDDIRVEGVTTDRIGYIAFDVEPNPGSGFGSSHVVFDSNTIGSYYMKAYSVIGNAPISDQEFTNNRVVGQSLKIGVVDKDYRPQQLRITGNSSDTAAAPAAMNLDGVDGLTVSGNTVSLTSGTMAQVDSSCNVSVSGNSYPGGSQEASITNPQCVAPKTTITKQPKGKTKKKQATFKFTSSEPGSTFQCSFDGDALTPCTSPEVEKVGKGKHEFDVVAVDPAGNKDGSPAEDSWKVKKKK